MGVLSAISGTGDCACTGASPAVSFISRWQSPGTPTIHKRLPLENLEIGALAGLQNGHDHLHEALVQRQRQAAQHQLGLRRGVELRCRARSAPTWVMNCVIHAIACWRVESSVGHMPSSELTLTSSRP